MRHRVVAIIIDDGDTVTVKLACGDALIARKGTRVGSRLSCPWGTKCSRYKRPESKKET